MRYDSTKEEDRLKGVAVGAVEKKKERGDRDGMDIGRGRIRWRIIVRIVGVWWRERESWRECEARSWRGCESQVSMLGDLARNSEGVDFAHRGSTRV